MSMKKMEKLIGKPVIIRGYYCGIGQTEFCKKTGVSAETYQKIKNNEPIRTSTVRKLCMTAGISFEWVMTGKGKMVEPVATSIDVSLFERAMTKLEEQLAKKDEVIQTLSTLLLKGSPGAANFLKVISKSERLKAAA